MDNVSYALHRKLPSVLFDDAVARVTDALKAEGFGVLTSIDIRKTFKEKLDADFRPYMILGACNPDLAYRALTSDDNIGLMLPCNVIVAATPEGTEVSIAKPEAMLGIAASEALEAIAEEAEERLERVLAQL